MAEPQLFQHYLFSQTPAGSTIELARSPEEVVCLAFDAERGRFVQFHVLVHPVDERGVFEHTVEAIQTIDSLSVARVIEAGCDDDSWYYITEHIDGEPLDTYLDRVRQVQGPVAAWLAHGMLDAIVQIGQATGMPLRFDFRDFRVIRRGDRLIPVLSRFPLHLSDDPAGGTRPFHVSKSAFERDAQPLRELLRTACRGRDRNARMKAGWVRTVELRRILELLIEGNQRLHLNELANLRDDLQKFTSVSPEDDFFSNSEPTSLLGAYIGDSKTAQRLVGSDYRLRPMPRHQLRAFAFPAEDRESGEEVTIQLLPPAALCGDKVGERVHEIVSHFNSKDHPRVVRVVCFNDSDPDGVWYAETVPPGVTLDRLLLEHGKLAPDHVHEILVKLQLALREAQTAGVKVPPITMQDIYVAPPLDLEDPDTGEPVPQTHFGPVTVRLHPTAGRLLGGVYQDAGQETAQPSEDWVIRLGITLLGLDPQVDRGRLKRKGLPEPLIKLVEAVWGRAPRSAASNRVEFLERFGRAIEGNRSSAKGSAVKRAGAIGRKISGLAPINLAGRKTSVPPDEPDQRGDTDPTATEQPPVVHPAPVPGFLQPETSLANDADEPAPGLAEVLFGRSDPDDRAQEDEDEPHPFAPIGGRPKMTADAKRYLRRRSLSNYAFLFAVLLVIAAAVAAGISHFGGNAIWQKPSVPDDLGRGAPGGETPPSATGASDNGDPQRELDTTVPRPTEIDPGVRDDEGPGRTAVTLPPPDGPPLDVGVGTDPTPPPAVPTPPSTGDASPAAPEQTEPQITRAVPVDPNQLPPPDDDESPPVPSDFADLLAAAEGGSVDAKSSLGRGLRDVQPEQARRWLRAAADDMDTEAMIVLAEMLSRGEGGAQDHGEAYRMLARAANQGSIDAYVPLAIAFLDGRGVEAQPDVAVEYLRVSATRNDPDANLMLARIYEQGRLGQPDIQEAAVWYRRAAELGHSVAQEWCRENGIPFSTPTTPPTDP